MNVAGAIAAPFLRRKVRPGDDLEGNAMRHANRIWLASLLLTLLVTALVAGEATLPATARAVTVKHVTIQNFSFNSRTITIKAGTRVTWKNMDATVHNVASASSIKTTAKVTHLFRSGRLARGKTFSFTFKKRGTFFYMCTLHRTMASMHGKVIVK